MSSTLVQPFRVRDATALLDDGQAATETGAEREEHYPVFVTRNREDAVERLAAKVDGAQAAVMNEETPPNLHGAPPMDALADIDTEAAAVSAREHSNTRRRKVAGS